MHQTDVAAATAFQYCSWETNKVIMEELLRNLCLAMIAVFIMTLILLANLLASFFVLISVTLTLVGVSEHTSLTQHVYFIYRPTSRGFSIFYTDVSSYCAVQMSFL